MPQRVLSLQRGNLPADTRAGFVVDLHRQGKTAEAAELFRKSTNLSSELYPDGTAAEGFPSSLEVDELRSFDGVRHA